MHLGAAWALLMGLASTFIATPPPGLDVADNRLSAILYIDALHRDRLVAAIAVLSESFSLCCECPGQLVEPGVVGLHLRDAMRVRQPSA